MPKMKHEDKCSNCCATKSETFWDHDNGRVLCDKCEKNVGKNSSKVTLLTYVAAIIVSIILIIFSPTLIFSLIFGWIAGPICGNEAGKMREQDSTKKDSFYDFLRKPNYAFLIGFLIPLIGIIYYAFVANKYKK